LKAGNKEQNLIKSVFRFSRYEMASLKSCLG